MNVGTYAVLKGHPDGTFDPPIPFNALGTLRGAYVADYDGDGWLDFAVANSSQNEIWVYRNTTGSAAVPGLGNGAALLAILALGTITLLHIRRA